MAEDFPKAMAWWCGGVLLFGAVLAAAALPVIDAPTLGLLRLYNGHAPLVTPELRFALGLMGAVSIGWGATLLAVTTATPLLPPDLGQIVWTRITRAAIVWYVIDSAISIGTGFWPNAVSNTVLLGLYLWIVRR